MRQESKKESLMIIRTLGRILLLLGIFLLFLDAGSAEVTVSDKELVKGKSLFLTISIVEEGKNTSLPSIAEIDGVRVENITRTGDFEYVSIRGKDVMQYLQSMTLELKPQKTLHIPAFTFMVDGQQKSTKEMTILVVKKREYLKSKEQEFFLSMKAEKKSVYLGEAFFLTVLFKQKKDVSVMKLEYERAKLKDFFVEQVGKEKRYVKGEYSIRELVYLLQAKRSGNLLLDATTVKVAKRNRRLQEGGWYNSVPDWKEVRSQSIDIEVMPLRKKVDILGDFTLKTYLSANEIEANKPLELELTLNGAGSLSDFKGFEYNIDNVTVYSDDAKEKRSFVNGKLYSSYVKSFVFISKNDFVIPAQEFKLFNPKTKDFSLLKIKESKIKVHKSADILDESNETGVSMAEVEALLDDDEDENLDSFNYWMLLLAFLLGMLFISLVKFLNTLLIKYRKEKEGFDGHEALRVLYPHVEKNKEVEEMVRQLYAVKRGEKNIKIDRKHLKEMLQKYQPKGVR